MTNNTPQFTIAELGAKFGALLGQLYSEIVTLEKMITFQQSQIEAMTKREIAMIDSIQELEDELIKLRPPPSSLSPEQLATANEAREILRRE